LIEEEAFAVLADAIGDEGNFRMMSPIDGTIAREIGLHQAALQYLLRRGFIRESSFSETSGPKHVPIENAEVTRAGFDAYWNARQAGQQHL
jgi:hypothetical protein